MSTHLAPKSRFIALPKRAPTDQSVASQWADMAATPLFQQAVETALCEMVAALGCTNLNDAAIMGYKLEGAKQLIYILTNLGEPKAQARSTARTDQLDPI